MNEVPDLARGAHEIQTFLTGIGRPSALIGGLAVWRWGDIRGTRDADFVVLCPVGDEEGVVDAVFARFAARMGDARDFALRQRVLLLRTAAGYDVDVSLGCMDIERRMVERSSEFAYPGPVTLRTVSADDLVVLKAFANRAIDWMDIKGIINRQGTKLAWKQIEAELEFLLEFKHEPEIWARLVELRDSLR